MLFPYRQQLEWLIFKSPPPGWVRSSKAPAFIHKARLDLYLIQRYPEAIIMQTEAKKTTWISKYVLLHTFSDRTVLLFKTIGFPYQVWCETNSFKWSVLLLFKYIFLFNLIICGFLIKAYKRGPKSQQYCGPNGPTATIFYGICIRQSGAMVFILNLDNISLKKLFPTMHI